MVGYVRLYVTDIDKFCRDVNTFHSDINIGEGNRLIDAKSLLSLVGLDLSQKLKLEIVTNNSYEENRFRDLLRIYNSY